MQAILDRCGVEIADSQAALEDFKREKESEVEALRENLHSEIHSK
jgi:hypothetical protein